MASIIKVSEILHPTANVPSLTINSDSTVSFDAGILSVTGPINGVIGANTPYSGTFTSLSDSGNLTFTGTGNRITGDFSNGTLVNRVTFQTSTANSATNVQVMPNGTSVTSVINLESDSALTNGTFFQVAMNGGADARIASNIRGTGTYLPMTFYTGGSEAMRITTDRNVGIGTSSPITTNARLSLKATGDYDAGLAIGSNASALNWARLDFKNTNAASPAILYQTQSGQFNIRTDGAYAIAFETNGGNERMRIDSSGNVGIGTSSPTEKLDVSGNVKVSGSLSVAGNNISPQTGFKNRIINGDFSVWQRGTTRYSNSGMAASAKYYADRWTSGQYQNAAFERVDRTTAGPASKYAMRVSSSSAAEDGSGTRMTLGQLIEHLNCADLAEKSITLSFWVRFSASSIASYGSFNYSLWQQDSVDLAFDSNGPTRSDTLTLTNGSFPTTWTKLTLVVTTASTMKNLAVQFSFSNLANTASNGSFWYEIAEVQLEKGSTATPFEFRSIGTELALCQRYYELSYPTGFTPGYNFSESFPFSTSKPIALNLVASDDTLTSQTIRFVVQKRTSPTVVIYSASNGASGSTFTYKGTGGTAINLAASVTYTSQDLWNINQSLGAINQTNESYLHFTASAEL